MKNSLSNNSNNYFLLIRNIIADKIFIYFFSYIKNLIQYLHYKILISTSCLHMHFHRREGKKIHCFLMHRKIFEKKKNETSVDRASGITRFSRNQYDGLNTKATKKSKQTAKSLYYKKKHFGLIYFPPPFYFHRGKTCFHVFFFFPPFFTRLKASRSTAKPFPFWRIKPVFFNQHEDKHVNVFNFFEKKENEIK